jgi:NAD(P)-dependent dehydrogenase (short-subunit alcohol dehydrogenase family)
MGNSLRGKVAFVTGVASKRGMGHEVSLRLAREGADVVICDKFAAPRVRGLEMRAGRVWKRWSKKLKPWAGRRLQFWQGLRIPRQLMPQ